MTEPRFDRDLMKECLECRACADDCPLSAFRDDYDPHLLLELIREGRIEEALEMPQVWWCLECYTCYELCYMKYGMIEPLRELKAIAMERGLKPPQIDSTLKVFKSTGMLTKASAGQRKKLGLPDPPSVAIEELKTLLGGR
ncbi:MAG: 4Fe-4S dicluster domain-containing protein [Armatimonadota bacterium]